MKLFQKIALSGLAALALLCAIGCANTVVVSTSTMIGVEINAADAGEQTAKVGYQRAEGVVMPIRKSKANVRCGESSIIPNAYPVISVFELKTGSLLLAGLGPLRLNSVFATGRAAVADNEPSSVVNSFSALKTGTYIKDPAGDALRRFWKPDGTHIDTKNQERIQQWLKDNNLSGESITFFMRSDTYAAQRAAAAKNLGLTP